MTSRASSSGIERQVNILEAGRAEESVLEPGRVSPFGVNPPSPAVS
jgi:hypothetical protein